MKKVIVYLEGKSDQFAMETLLSQLIEQKFLNETSIVFIGLPPSRSNKAYLLTKIPKRAISIISNDPSATIVVIPDLYPKNSGFTHETADELIKGIKDNFKKELQKKNPDFDTRLLERFKAFCFKHDLESLILAACEALKSRLSPCKPNSWQEWTTPVEDQNNDIPPRRIVEKLFKECKKRYIGTVDAPMILSKVNYSDIAERCPQCFKPFIEYLESL